MIRKVEFSKFNCYGMDASVQIYCGCLFYEKYIEFDGL